MSWFTKAEAWFKKFFSNTNWAHNASVGLAVAGPPAILILQDTLGTADAAEAQSVINEVQTDLGTVTMLLTQAQSGDASVGARISTLLTTISSNLGAILSDAHVKNSANAAKITNLVNALIAEANVVISMIPATPAAPPVAAA